MRRFKELSADFAGALCLYNYGLQWTTTSLVVNDADSVAKSAFNAPDAVWRLYTEHLPGSDTVILGLVGFEHIKPLDRVCEPYIAVWPDQRKRGLGSEIATRWRDYAWNVLNMRRIQTTVLFDSPSRKLLEKLDFKLEGAHKGVRFRNGEYVDAVTYALIKE